MRCFLYTIPWDYGARGECRASEMQVCTAVQHEMHALTCSRVHLLHTSECSIVAELTDCQASENGKNNTQLKRELRSNYAVITLCVSILPIVACE